MTESMIERVARALMSAQESRDLDYASPMVREAYLFAARAAIEAMREPTEEMLDAAYVGSEIGDFMDGLPDEVLSQAFTDMIDAALKEGTP